MTDVLERMKAEKRLRLINSAMKEFGANSFDKASTNVIVKEAGISKGLLYHYFETKEALFDYLVIFTLKSMGEAIVDRVDWVNGDLIERMQSVIYIKLEILKQYPNMLDFGKVMFGSKTVDEIKNITDQYVPNIHSKVYSHNIDYSLFKENIDVARAVKMIQLFLDGYSEQVLKKFKKSIESTGEIKDEMDELSQYLEMYREAFYKKEGRQNDL